MEPHRYARLEGSGFIARGANEADTEATLKIIRETREDMWLWFDGLLERQLYLRLLAAIASNPVFASTVVKRCEDEEIGRAVIPLVERQRSLILYNTEPAFLSTIMPALATTRTLSFLSLNQMNITRRQATRLSQTLRRSRIRKLAVFDVSRPTRLYMPNLVRGLMGAPHLTSLAVGDISSSTVDHILQAAYAIPNLQMLTIGTRWDKRHLSISSRQALCVEQMVRAPPKNLTSLSLDAHIPRLSIPGLLRANLENTAFDFANNQVGMALDVFLNNPLRGSRYEYSTRGSSWDHHIVAPGRTDIDYDKGIFASEYLQRINCIMVKRRRMTRCLWKAILSLSNIKSLFLLHTEIES